MSYNDRRRCSEPGCPERVGDHRWGAIKAQSEGWFYQRNGEAYCPQHVPAWVPAWREKKARERA